MKKLLTLVITLTALPSLHAASLANPVNPTPSNAANAANPIKPTPAVRSAARIIQTDITAGNFANPAYTIANNYGEDLMVSFYPDRGSFLLENGATKTFNPGQGTAGIFACLQPDPVTGCKAELKLFTSINFAGGRYKLVPDVNSLNKEYYNIAIIPGAVGEAVQ